MSVKRLRWEQVENSEGTIWGQVGDLGPGRALHQGRLAWAAALKIRPCPVSSLWHFPASIPPALEAQGSSGELTPCKGPLRQGQTS